MADPRGSCPSCGVELVRARTAVTETTACPRCGGVWQDAASSRRVVAGLLRDAEKFLAQRVQAGAEVASFSQELTEANRRDAHQRSLAVSVVSRLLR